MLSQSAPFSARRSRRRARAACVRDLIVPSGSPRRSDSSDCDRPVEVGERQHLALRRRQLIERDVDAAALEPLAATVRGTSSAADGLGQLRGRVRGPGLLAADEVDGLVVHERQEPRRGLRAGDVEPRGTAPDGEEPLLDGVLRQRRVADDPQGQSVGRSAVPVVQRRERAVVARGAARYQACVRELAGTSSGSRWYRTAPGRERPRAGTRSSHARAVVRAASASAVRPA